MKNNKIIKTLALAACAILLVVGSVAGTFAYLTSTTDPVTNTFTAGKVSITLDETDVNVYGTKDSNNRVTENAYKLIPGHTYVKDPTIHVKAGSEECYLFVKVVNGISDIEDSAKSIASQMTANGWVIFDADEGIYVLDHPVNALGANDVDVAVFANFTINATADNVADYVTTDANKIMIEVTAYAVQADGVTGDNLTEKATSAWTNGQFS